MQQPEQLIQVPVLLELTRLATLWLPTALVRALTVTTSITITAAPAATISYVGNPFCQPGGTGAILVVDIDGYGTYTARVTSAAGCTALSNAVTIISGILSDLFVYPNPNSGQFQVRVYNPSGKQLTVIVHSSNTQLVYNKTMVTSTPYTRMDVDLRNVADGNYVVSVVDGNDEIIGSKMILIAK